MRVLVLSAPNQPRPTSPVDEKVLLQLQCATCVWEDIATLTQLAKVLPQVLRECEVRQLVHEFALVSRSRIAPSAALPSPSSFFARSKNDTPTRVRYWYCDFLTSWGLRSSQRPEVQAASASQQSGASNGTSSGCPLGQIIIQGEFQHPCGARQANDRAAMPVFVPCKNPDEAPFCYGAGAGSS